MMEALSRTPAPAVRRMLYLVTVLLLFLALLLLGWMQGASPVAFDGLGVAIHPPEDPWIPDGSRGEKLQRGVQSDDQPIHLFGGVVVHHARPDHSLALA